TAGLEIQTVDEIFEERLAELVSRAALNAEQVAFIRNDPRGVINLLLRIDAEREAAMQQKLVEVLEAIGLDARGVQLDRSVELVGGARAPARNSRVSGVLYGTDGATWSEGSRVQFEDGSIWVLQGTG